MLSVAEYSSFYNTREHSMHLRTILGKGRRRGGGGGEGGGCLILAAKLLAPDQDKAIEKTSTK